MEKNIVSKLFGFRRNGSSMNFEQWQLMNWWFMGCPIDAMPGGGENQPKLTDFLIAPKKDLASIEYEWDKDK